MQHLCPQLNQRQTGQIPLTNLKQRSALHWGCASSASVIVKRRLHRLRNRAPPLPSGRHRLFYEHSPSRLIMCQASSQLFWFGWGAASTDTWAVLTLILPSRGAGLGWHSGEKPLKKRKLVSPQTQQQSGAVVSVLGS